MVLGEDITITILEVRGDVVRVGIDAPRSLKVHRAELLVQLEQSNRQAASPADEVVADLTRALGSTGGTGGTGGTAGPGEPTAPSAPRPE